MAVLGLEATFVGVCERQVMLARADINAAAVQQIWVTQASQGC